MEFEARKFARRVLITHLALLIVLLGIVSIAARVIYGSARRQAIAQAQHTQALLAKQTALGIQNYYESVTNVLNLLQPADGDSSTRPANRPATQLGTRLSAAQRDGRRRALDDGPLARIANVLGLAIWGSIHEKASMLFVVDTTDDMSVIRIIGANDEKLAPSDVVDAAKPWLATVSAKQLSSMISMREPNGGSTAHLVAVPMRGPAGLLMVGVVPVASLERDVLQYVNRSATTSAMVVDERGVFISAAGEPQVVGRNISEIDHPRTRVIAADYITRKRGGTEVFNDTTPIGDGSVSLKPGMTTIEPVEVLGRTWFVSVSSDLREVDNIVKPIFRDAMAWSIFVALAMMLILASTATQLIRSRHRLERERHEVMTREIEDARTIQLHWLPKEKCGCAGVDVVAINQPATHISGDFYDWFQLEDGRLVVTIGDVTGHGMTAAFLMATTQLLVRNVMHRVGDPGRCLREVNRQLCTQTFNGQFVTMIILVIDVSACTMTIATAGHQAPLVGSGAGFAALELTPQLVMGVDADAKYESERFDLAPGSGLVLYTDGAIDAQSPAGERFSTTGLAASLFGRYESADAIVAAIQASVDEFRRGRDLSDDLTIVAIQLQSVGAIAPTAAQTVRAS